MFSKIIYFVLLLIALAIYSMQRLGLQLPAIINNYVNDLLCLPLLLGVMNYIIRFLKKEQSYVFPIGFILFLASYYSVYFELYLPTVNARYTADWIDVYLYFSGGLGYYFYMKNKVN